MSAIRRALAKDGVEEKEDEDNGEGTGSKRDGGAGKTWPGSG